MERGIGKRAEAAVPGAAAGRAEGTGMDMGRVVAGREVVAAAASWGRGLGKRGAAAARGVVGRADGKEGVAGRGEGKDGLAGRTEGKGGVAGRAEGKDGVAGDAVAVGVAAPTPKAGKAEPGPREEGPASRPKPDAAIDSAESRNTKP